jgi:hypothetical protein
VIKNPRGRGHSPRWAAEPEKKNNNPGILEEGRRRSTKYQRDNTNFPDQYSKPGVKNIKRNARLQNLAGKLGWSRHLSVTVIKPTEMYGYKFSVQAVTT